jgi:hypothetical protein
MKFESADAARAALGESLGWISDVEWLASNAIDSFLGPTGSFACFDQDESDEFLQCVLPWIYRVKSAEEDALKIANPPDVNLKISFADALLGEPGRVGAEEAAEILLRSFQELERAMRPENRYQYFVGNLLKTKEELEAEFDLVQKILTDEVYLWRYLEVLFVGPGLYSFAGVISFVGLFKKLDAAFQALFTDVYLNGNPLPRARELSRIAAAIQLAIDASDSIDKAGTLLGDGASMKVFSVSEAAAQVKIAPELLLSYAGECQFNAPFSAREVIAIKRYIHRLEIRQKELAQQNAAKALCKDDHRLAAVGNISQAREDLKHKYQQNAQVKQPLDSGKSSVTRVERVQDLSAGWKFIGKLALGAAVVFAGALAASALVRNEEEEGVAGEYFLLPSNFAGLLPDGTHTYWGSRGGRYYRTETGRKIYI